MEAPFMHDVSSRFGAPMRRRSNIPAAFAGRKTYLRRVPMVDGAYDPGGAYWGAAIGSVPPLWCAWTYSDDGDLIVRYFRARDRASAKEELPGALFYR